MSDKKSILVSYDVTSINEKFDDIVGKLLLAANRQASDSGDINALNATCGTLASIDTNFKHVMQSLELINTELANRKVKS